MDNLIRVERARKRLTQAELAIGVGVSRQTIHHLENKKFIPSITLSLRIALYLNVDVEYLFTLEENDFIVLKKKTARIIK